MSEDDENQLYMAHERIRLLNRQLLMQEDALVQIAALKRKIALAQERAQEIVQNVNKRIACLTELWSEPSKKDSPTVEMDSNPLKFTEEGKMSDSSYSNYNAVLDRAIKTLENMTLSIIPLGNSKNEATRLANELRNFLTTLQSPDQNMSKGSEKSVSMDSNTTSCTTASSVEAKTSTANSTNLPTGTASNATTEITAAGLSNTKTPPPSPSAPTAALPTATQPKTAEKAQSPEVKTPDKQPPVKNNP